MTIASFFAMLAAMLTRFGLYAGMFGGFGGGNRDNNNNQVPVWLIVFLVSIVVYAISFVLIRTISRYREYAADRGSAIITGAPENLMSALQKISSGITQIPQREQGEPLAEVGLDRELLFELRLQLELLRVVPLMLLAGRDERPPRPRLEAVDPVDGMAGAERASFELERRGEQLPAEAVVLQFRR